MADWNAWFGILMIGIALTSAVLAFVMSAQLEKSNPAKKPYAWGYFIGWQGILFGIGFGIFTVVDYVTYSKNASIGISGSFLLFFIALVITHYLVVKRNKWGWVFGIPLQINPVIWVINIIYLKNRWGELGGSRRSLEIGK